MSGHTTNNMVVNVTHKAHDEKQKVKVAWMRKDAFLCQKMLNVRLKEK